MLDALINHVIHRQISEQTKELIETQSHIKKMKCHLEKIREYQRLHRVQAQERLVQVLLQKETKIQGVINNLETLREHRQHPTISSSFGSSLTKHAEKTI